MIDNIKNTYTLFPMHIFGIWGIYNIIQGNAPAWWMIATIIGYVFFKMLGIGACYHRMLSHNSFQTSKWTKKFMLWCGAVSGQGSPIFWVTVHRGYHHRFTDTAKDLHSPIDGFWHSYCLWLFKIDYKNLSLKGAVNLLRDNDVMFVHTHYNKIVLLSHATLAFISFDLWIYFMLLPCLISFHSFCCQTSFVHYKKLGYRNYETKDNSVNIPWLFPLSTGECWHNNHHGDPGNANFGKYWWELDPTYWLIKLIRNKKHHD